MRRGSLAIRAMRRRDLGAVMRIEKVSFPTPWSKTMFLREMRDDNDMASFIVARMGRVLVGYCGFWLIVDECHIGNLAVHPEWRRRQIGEKLLGTMLAEARRGRARRATLEVRRSNIPAQSLYRKYGFREVAVRRRYYADTGEDALIMDLEFAELLLAGKTREGENGEFPADPR